jgi:hypothetical protein
MGYLRDIFEAFRYMNPSMLCFAGSLNVELARIPVFALNLGFVFFVCAVTIVTLSNVPCKMIQNLCSTARLLNQRNPAGLKMKTTGMARRSEAVCFFITRSFEALEKLFRQLIFFNELLERVHLSADL